MKKWIIYLTTLCALIVMFVAGYFFWGAKKGSEPIIEEGSLQKEMSTSFSFYEGKFVSYENGIIRIKLNEDSEIGGFLLNDKTIIMHGLTQGDQYSEEVKKISDIPRNASVSIEVNDGDTEQAYTAKRIVYRN